MWLVSSNHHVWSIMVRTLLMWNPHVMIARVGEHRTLIGPMVMVMTICGRYEHDCDDGDSPHNNPRGHMLIPLILVVPVIPVTKKLTAMTRNDGE